MQKTPVSLLERVRNQSDQEAWGRFVQLYTPLLFYWARRCGLQADDAADLTQDVFVTLFQKLPEFAYDQHKSFRSWLRQVTLNHWRDRQRRAATRPLPGDADRLDALEAPHEIAALDEDEYQQHLMSQALRIMRADFQPVTWQAFWEHGVLGRQAAEVAAETGLSLAAVYGAKFRVLSRLRQELQGLLD
jgi:RNA polymerase sigma-70 factor (ECF subfamily)